MVVVAEEDLVNYRPIDVVVAARGRWEGMDRPVDVVIAAHRG